MRPTPRVGEVILLLHSPAVLLFQLHPGTCCLIQTGLQGESVRCFLRTIGLKSNSRVSRVGRVRYFNQLLRPIFSPEGRASLPLGREFCLLAGRIHLLLNVVCVCMYIFIGDVRDMGSIPG